MNMYIYTYILIVVEDFGLDLVIAKHLDAPYHVNIVSPENMRLPILRH